MSSSYSRVLAVIATLTAATATSRVPAPAPKELPGAIEFYDTPGNDAVADRLYIEERILECLERLAGDLEASAVAKGPTDRDTLRHLFRLVRVSSSATELHLSRRLFPSLVANARATLAEGDPLYPEILVRAASQARRDQRPEEFRALVAEARAAAAKVEGRHVILDSVLDTNEEVLSRATPEERIRRWRADLALRRREVRSPSLSEAAATTWLAVRLDRARRMDEVPAAIDDARGVLADLGATQGTYALVLDGLETERAVLQGHWDDAVVLARRSAAKSEAFRDRAAAGVLSRRTVALQGYPILALRAAETGQGEAAWRYLEHWRAPHNVDMAWIGMWPETDPHGWEVYRTAQAALLQARDRASAVDFGWDGTTWRTTMAWIRARLRVLRLETNYLCRQRSREPSIEAAKRALGPRDALVGWLEVNLGGELGPGQTPLRLYRWGYVLRRDRPIAWVELLAGRPFEERIELMWGSAFPSLDRASRWPTRVDDDPKLRDGLRGWSRSLLDPLLPHLDGVERIVFADLRFPMNLHTLPDGSPIGDRFDVAVVPSGQTLAMAPPWESRMRRGRSVAALLYPETPEGDRGTTSAPRAIRAPIALAGGQSPKVPRLPSIPNEIQAVASWFPDATRLTGASGSIRSLNQLIASGGMGRFDTVHVAAHTLSASDPEMNAFSLSGATRGSSRDDAILDAEEILRGWRIDPDLLTLSGCDTSVSAGRSGGEAFGFVPVAAAVGARRVLASTLPVDDEATALLMKRFYQSYTDPSAPTAERALRDAQAFVRNYRDASGRRRFAHPTYWASFQVIELR